MKEISCTKLQLPPEPLTRGYRPQIPVLCVVCPQLTLLKPPPPKKKIPGYDLAPLRTSEAPCWNHCKEIAYHARWLVGSSELLHGLVGLFPDSSTVPSSRFKASKKNEDFETPFRNVGSKQPTPRKKRKANIWTAQRWKREISQVIRRFTQSFQTNARISN